MAIGGVPWRWRHDGGCRLYRELGPARGNRTGRVGGPPPYRSSDSEDRPGERPGDAPMAIDRGKAPKQTASWVRTARERASESDPTPTGGPGGDWDPDFRREAGAAAWRRPRPEGLATRKAAGRGGFGNVRCAAAGLRAGGWLGFRREWPPLAGSGADFKLGAAAARRPARTRRGQRPSQQGCTAGQPGAEPAEVGPVRARPSRPGGLACESARRTGVRVGAR